ncbi:hypothetical protein EGW08_021840 [Elysia chlorotica]|uniref:G-protein coupled receptors family 1 profile domain-containing protein n=1 Tax=Elysia chlorotica TaxID=188477 RepID=A0A433SML3_ELYCH|nr:hypothetical protein EGW08_021840 [Elysia chlorotica]
MNNSTTDSIQGNRNSIQHASSNNIWFGIIGFIANSLSTMLVLMCKSLRTHQKISTMSLVLNDLIFMASVTAYGLLSHLSGMDLVLKLCWPVVYATLSSHAVTFATISYITFTSYWAVFKPHQFQTLTGTIGTVATIVCIWIASWLFVLACIRFDFPVKERGCSLYLLVPGVGMIMWATVPIVCTGFVTIVNINILLFLKRPRNVKNARVGPREAPWRCGAPQLCGMGDVTRREVSDPRRSAHVIHVRPSCSTKQEIGGNPPNIATTEDRSSDSGRGSDSLNLRQENTSEHVLHPAAFSGLQLLDVPQTFAGNRKSNENVQTMAGSSARANIDTHTCPSTSTNVQGGVPDAGAGPVNRRKSKAIITLVLLTLFSCLFSLPEVILFLATGIQPDNRQYILNSNFAKFCKLFTGINALADPILYCWRLINWASVRSYVVSRWRAVAGVNT